VEQHLKLVDANAFVLGEGSFGKVYGTLETKHHCPKAVKVVQLTEEMHLVAAVAEVRALQHLPPHPNLLKGELFWRSGSTPALCIVMPQCLCSVENFLLGFNLAMSASDRQKLLLPSTTCSAFSTDLLAAVRHLHWNGVVHGDLSPNNLLVDSRQHRAVLRVGDLGMSRVVQNWHGEPPPRRPIRGLPGGWCTFSYCAPENVERSSGGKVGFPIDDWSVGAMISEWRLGWWWTRPNGYEVWRREDWANFKGKLLQEVLDELRFRAPELDPPVVQALCQLLEVNPNNRAPVCQVAAVLGESGTFCTLGRNPPLAAYPGHCAHRS